MNRRLLSLSLVACFAAACAPAATDSDADLEDEGGTQSGVEVWAGLGLQGIHDAPMNQELLDLFPKGGGWAFRTLYSTDYDWIGNLGNETSWAKNHGFAPVVRVDYARPDGSTYADGSPTLGASVPMPGDVGYCLARSGGGPSRNVGGKHLDCYLAFFADLVPTTPDVHNWVIGNEMNMLAEAKGHPGGKIDPNWYGQVYRAARNKIHSYPGHEKDAVFVGGVAPGDAGGPAYQSGKSYLSQMLYALSPNEVDGIAMHAYGGWAKDCDNGGTPAVQNFEQGSGGGMGYRNQAQWIDALGFSRTPLLITEMSVNLHVQHGAPNPACGNVSDGYLYDRKEAANFMRNAYQSIYEWNQGPTNHDILGGIYFIYDAGSFGSESLKNMRDQVTSAGYGTSPTENPYYAFRELAEKGAYAHGDPNGYGDCWKSSDNSPLKLDDDPYTMSGKIRDSWKANGGLEVFGYPIQGASCQADTSGRVLYAQSTQRARLEYHPELAGTSFEVSFGLLGRPLASGSGVNPDAWSSQSAAHGSDCEWIGVNSNTGHYVCGAILKHYKSHGVNDPSLSAADRSLRLFGLPISEAVQYKGMTVQWFERARLELHPENAEPYNVLGGFLGCEASGIQGFGCN